MLPSSSDGFECCRKLYEQDKFPGAKIIPIFEKYFGKFERRNLLEVKQLEQLLTRAPFVIFTMSDLCSWVGAKPLPRLLLGQAGDSLRSGRCQENKAGISYSCERLVDRGFPSILIY